MRMLLAVVFLLAFWVGRDTAKVGLLLPKPFSKAVALKNLSSPGNKTVPPGVPAKSESLHDILNASSSGRLFRALFDEKIFAVSDPEEVLSEVRERFRKRYPKNVRSEFQSGFEKEIVQRVGILKAMPAIFPPGTEFSEEAYDFYRELLRREPFLVKRQALRNLIPMLGMKSEQERQQIYKEAGGRTLASAANSDEEILEQVFHDPR